MKLNFKKIASVLTSTVMLGSTLALAAAANYPAPFVKNGNADVAVVYGSSGAVTDLVAVSDIQTQLATNLAQQTTVGSSTGASATGGDSINLASSSQNLYFNSPLNAAKNTLTKTDMPNVLADGTITDNTGTAYTYTQSLVVGSNRISYGVPTGASSMDPVIYLNIGNDPSAAAYTYKLTLNKVLNVSNSNVVGNDLNILGNKYTVGANSIVVGTAGSDVLYLYGSGNQVNLNEGDQQTVSISGKDHTIKVTGITQSGSTNQVYVSVDGGATQKINEGSASNIGGVQIYAKTVFYSGKTGSTNYATLSLGSNVLKLQDGQQVAVGTDAIPLQGTKVIIGGSGTGLSSLSINISMPTASKTYLAPGQKLTDPVFGGLALQYADVSPGSNVSSNDVVTVDTDNSRTVRVSFNSALSGQATAWPFLRDQRSDTSTGAPNMRFADTGNYTIHEIEGTGVLTNEYTTINSGDYGRIVKVTSLPTGALQSSSTIQVQDVITGTNLLGDSGLTVGTTGNATATVDGQTYYFHVNNGTSLTGITGSSVNITWGSGATYNSPGTVTTIAPRIKLANGEWLALLKPVTFANGTTISLPGLDSVADYEAGLQVNIPSVTVNGVQNFTKQFGNINYTFDVTNSSASATASNLTLSGVQVGSTIASSVYFNSSLGGAVLIQEEKKPTEQGNSNYGDAIVIGTQSEGSSSVLVSVKQPQITGGTQGTPSSSASFNVSAWTSWNSNSNVQSAVDRYGSLVSFDSSNDNVVNVWYPVQQQISDVLFTSDSATVVSGSSGGSGLKSLGSVIVSDGDVSSVSGKNLIVVGGSCVNMVAAKLLGSSSSLCGSDWETATGVGSGSFLIQTFTSPYASNKIATLVAGYNAPDTTNAAKALQTQSIDTTAGKKYTGNVANSVTLATTSS